MALVEIIHIVIIFVGALIMLFGIGRANEIMEYVEFVPEKDQRHLKRDLLLHRGLMIFFLVGYFVVLVSYIFHFHIISETLVSLIFFFGGVFVFIGTSVKTRLLRGVKTTLKGILPICSTCKKIRAKGGDPKDQASWKIIEEYISQQTDVEFSHSYCPICYDEAIREINSVCK